MGLRIFRRALRLRAVVGRRAAEVHRSRRTARESSAAEPSLSSRQVATCCALFRKRSYCVCLSVSSSVETRKTIYCEEWEEESVRYFGSRYAILLFGARVVSMATTPERMRSRYSNSAVDVDMKSRMLKTCVYNIEPNLSLFLPGMTVRSYLTYNSTSSTAMLS